MGPGTIRSGKLTSREPSARQQKLQREFGKKSREVVVGVVDAVDAVDVVDVVDAAVLEAVVVAVQAAEVLEAVVVAQQTVVVVEQAAEEVQTVVVVEGEFPESLDTSETMVASIARSLETRPMSTKDMEANAEGGEGTGEMEEGRADTEEGGNHATSIPNGGTNSGRHKNRHITHHHLLQATKLPIPATFHPLIF